MRPTLVADLRSTIQRAIKTDSPARKERALIKLQGRNYKVNIQVVPFKIPGSDKPSFLVIFDETTKGTKLEKIPRALGKTAGQHEITDLRRELAASKESLQAIIEEQEATNEELKSANEEIESSNEELQSTNEELETAKEELQSTNEELTTLNEELSNRNLEMMQLTGELNNLLDSIQMPIVMVDNALTVRRATPAARGAFNILPTDTVLVSAYFYQAPMALNLSKTSAPNFRNCRFWSSRCTMNLSMHCARYVPARRAMS